MTKKKTEKTYWIAKNPSGYFDARTFSYRKYGSIILYGRTSWESFAKKEGWKIVKVKLVEV